MTQNGDPTNIAPALNSLRVPLGDLTLDQANARKHDARNLAAIGDSLTRFGQRLPVVVQKQGMVVRAGNGRVEAARALGWSEVAAVVVDESNVDATAYALVDNRTAELAEWDDETLRATLAALEADEAIPAGWTDDELAEIFGSADENLGDVEEDQVPEVPDEPTAKRGQLWELGDHRVLCGDLFDLPPDLGWTAEACVMDPPYVFAMGSTMAENSKAGGWSNSLNQSHWFSKMLRAVLEIMPRGLIWQCLNWRSVPVVMKGALETGLEVQSLAVWDKEWIGPGGPKGLRPSYELIALYCVGARVEDRGVPDVVRVPWSPGKRTSGHGAEKPPDLMAWCIKHSPAGAILDPFLGSGTTLIAAEQLGRTCYGIEIEPRYVDVIIQRWENLTGETAVLAGAGAAEELLA